ncbi:MAG: YdcF family protein [Bacteroidetes bacterium]|nr:YdcF family protein [Bacteroidota bacterium]
MIRKNTFSPPRLLIVKPTLYIPAIGVILLMVSCALFKPSPEKLTKRALKAHEKYDAVIVPGVPFVEPYWDRVMQMRVLWAVHLFKKGYTKNIIMSGASVYSPFVEAQIMKAYAVKLGVPEQNVFTEEKAEHSTENVWYGYKIAKAHNFHAVALASDPFQTRLLLRFGKRRVKDIKYLPVLFDTLRTLPHDTPSIDYEKLRVSNFVPLPERQSKWERLRGTWGKHIDFKE